MSQRKFHKSLVPGWIDWFAEFDYPFIHALPLKLGRFGKIRCALLAVIFVGFLWSIAGFCKATTVHHKIIIMNFEDPSFLLSGYWLIPLVIVFMGLLTMRFLVFRWICQTWHSITGERNFERHLHTGTKRYREVEEVLRGVAQHVRTGKLQVDRFHMARDIAALYWLCDRNLRIRDLVDDAQPHVSAQQGGES